MSESSTGSESDRNSSDDQIDNTSDGNSSSGQIDVAALIHYDEEPSSPDDMISVDSEGEEPFIARQCRRHLRLFPTYGTRHIYNQ